MGTGLAAKVMRLWHHRAKGLSHDYALLGYLLSPHPVIMQHAIDNRSMQHDDAVRRVVSKLMLPDDLVGDARNERRAQLVHQFWKEYSDFTTRTGAFAHPDMWIMAADDNVKAPGVVECVW